MLFPLCINYIYDAITSQIKPFADDGVLCRNRCSQNGQAVLQNDLDTISSRDVKWFDGAKYQ